MANIQDSFIRNIKIAHPLIAICAVLMCTSCSEATKARMSIGWNNLTSKISTKKPEKELLNKVNLPGNYTSIENKRLFMYRYYPELYDVIYKQRTNVNPQSLVNWYAEQDRRYDTLYRYDYNADPQKLYRTK